MRRKDRNYWSLGGDRLRCGLGVMLGSALLHLWQAYRVHRSQQMLVTMAVPDSPKCNSPSDFARNLAPLFINVSIPYTYSTAFSFPVISSIVMSACG